MESPRCEYCDRDYKEAILEKHTDTCKYKPIDCDYGCGIKIYRRQLVHHKTNECIKRAVACKFCNENFTATTINSHYKVCPKMLVSCPHKCEVALLPREELETHTDRFCSIVVLPCSFKYAGCLFKAKESILKKHMEEEGVAYHFKLLESMVSQQQSELTKKQIELSDAQKLTIEKQDMMIQEQAKFIESTEKLTEFQTQLTSTMKKVTVFRAELGILNRIVGEMRMTKREKLTWRITDWTKKMSDAKAGINTEIYSQSFYVLGYHLQGLFYPNGHKKGLGTHISLFLQIIPGEYDSSLRWPFMEEFSVTLLDKGHNKQNQYTNVLTSSTNTNTECFQIPNGKPNRGWGFQTYLEQDFLDTYVIDDSIVIKVD